MEVTKLKLLIFVLNRVEYLERLLSTLQTAGIRGGTILNSTGMARELLDSEEINFLGSLRQFLDPSRVQSKTLLFVLKDEMVQKAIDAITSVVGDLTQPDSGIMFTVPVDFTKGIKNQ